MSLLEKSSATKEEEVFLKARGLQSPVGADQEFQRRQALRARRAGYGVPDLVNRAGYDRALRIHQKLMPQSMPEGVDGAKLDRSTAARVGAGTTSQINALYDNSPQMIRPNQGGFGLGHISPRGPGGVLNAARRRGYSGGKESIAVGSMPNHYWAKANPSTTAQVAALGRPATQPPRWGSLKGMARMVSKIASVPVMRAPPVPIPMQYLVGALMGGGAAAAMDYYRLSPNSDTGISRAQVKAELDRQKDLLNAHRRGEEFDPSLAEKHERHLEAIRRLVDDGVPARVFSAGLGAASGAALVGLFNHVKKQRFNHALGLSR